MINSEIAFRQFEYGKGHGFLNRDRYIYEGQASVKLGAGRNEIRVTSGNDYGAWIFSMRFTDEEGIPVPGLHFSLE